MNPSSQVLLVLSALSFSGSAHAQAAWIETDRAHDCIFFKQHLNERHIPLRVVCDWSIPVEKVLAAVEPLDLFDQYLTGVLESTRVDSPLPNIRILQIHGYPGLTNRAAFLDYTILSIPKGKRIIFTKAEDQSLLPSNHIEIELNTGFWEITSEGKGSRVIFESSYLPGGYIPSFLIAWFQGPGTQQVMSELKDL